MVALGWGEKIVNNLPGVIYGRVLLSYFQYSQALRLMKLHKNVVEINTRLSHLVNFAGF